MHQYVCSTRLSSAVSFVTMIVLACCGELRRQTPHNYIALMIFTVAESFLLGIVSSLYEWQIVLTAVAITALVCLALTAFAFQTKIDFTVFNGILFIGIIILMLFGFVLMFWRSPIAHLIYSCLGALLFSAVSLHFRVTSCSSLDVKSYCRFANWVHTSTAIDQ